MFVLLALIPFFTWALGYVFGTFASRKVGNVSTSTIFIFFSFLFCTLYLPFAGRVENWFFFILAFLLGGAYSVGLFAYFHALEIGNASLVGAIAGSFSVVVVIFSVIFFHDKLTTIQVMGVLLCIGGIIIASFHFEDLKQKSLKRFLSDPGILLSLLTFLSWGVYFTFIRIPVEHVGWFWTLYPSTFYFLPLLFFKPIRKQLRRIHHSQRTVFFILLMTLSGRTGDVAYNIAITKGVSSILGAIAGSSPIFFVTLAYFIFKDKLTRQQMIGIITTTSGILILAFAAI